MNLVIFRHTALHTFVLDRPLTQQYEWEEEREQYYVS